MSNIYIQEPPALGKVLLKTTVGDIDLELWTKETPKACRNFIQLCMENYYNGTIFHRVVPHFIIQGGDPNGDGSGGESIYGTPFKDEFHTRLRFNRRGLVAMANSEKDDNGSQFFFTLDSTPELQNKHTIFGKVTGETIYNMLKLAEGEIDHNERPTYPHKIISCHVLINPFEDIIPRNTVKQEESIPKKEKKKEKGIKNFGLLSFGVEAEEEEDQSVEFRGKSKSTHDLLDDPKLSKLTANDMKSITDEESNIEVSKNEENTKITVENIRDKLSSKKKKLIEDKPTSKSDDNASEGYYLGKDKKEAKEKQMAQIREEIRDLKKEMTEKRLQCSTQEEKRIEDDKPLSEVNELVQQYEYEQEKYRKKMDEMPKKGTSREMETHTQYKFNKKPWIKTLYENTGLYPDNYTDKMFLQEMKKNINIQNITFTQSFFGSCIVTQKISMCILFSIIFTYLYNEWISSQLVFISSCFLTVIGYILFFLTFGTKKYQNSNVNFEDNENISKTHSIKKIGRKKSQTKNYKKKLKDEKYQYCSITSFIFEDLKMVLIYLVFGYLFSPLLHTLTDTVSTDTIFATSISMMLIHLIFTDYGISVAIVSNSLSINSAIFASICLASRLATPFCAFVLLTVSIQVFVLSPVFLKIIWDTKYAIFMFILSVIVSFILLWKISTTLFYFFLITVITVNFYFPYLFVRWQKYKDNIYGPWDEAIVHDSDDISNCVGIKSY